MSSPSRTTVPPVGLSSRESVFNRVDLPQPLGPMIVVTTPGGIATSSPSMTTLPPYPTVTPLAASREASSTPAFVSVMDCATTSPPYLGMPDSCTPI